MPIIYLYNTYNSDTRGDDLRAEKTLARDRGVQ